VRAAKLQKYPEHHALLEKVREAGRAAVAIMRSPDSFELVNYIGVKRPHPDDQTDRARQLCKCIDREYERSHGGRK